LPWYPGSASKSWSGGGGGGKRGKKKKKEGYE